MNDYKLQEMKELITKINQWNYEYYTLDNSTVSDKKWDEEFEKLKQLEEETGIILSNSPTQQVGGDILPFLKKIEHKYPMLSLDKAYSYSEVIKFTMGRIIIAMLKLDGLTVDIVYKYGKLDNASTRGKGGLIGEDVTHNVKVALNVPLIINSNDPELHIIGEMVLLLEQFDKINNSLPEGAEKFKNRRNLAAGTLRQLDSSIAKERGLSFFGYYAKSKKCNFKTKEEELKFIKKLGFDIVPYNILINIPRDKEGEEFLENVFISMRSMAERRGIPIDGIVVEYDDISYGESLGTTNHHPKHSLAFKYEPDQEETVLQAVRWETGRTGKITPTAYFNPVELAETTVKQATLDNVSQIEKLNIGIGSRILVEKRGEIIPKIVKVFTKGEKIHIPQECPCCGAPTEIRQEKDSKVLYCTGTNCGSVNMKIIDNFCSKDGMNIKGLSQATLQTFLDNGIISEIKDLFYLKYKEKEILKIPKFGKKKFDNLIAAIEESKQVKLENFLVALSIPNVGIGTARDIVKYFQSKMPKASAREQFDSFMLNLRRETKFDDYIPVFDLRGVEGISESAKAMEDYLLSDKIQLLLTELLIKQKIQFIEPEKEVEKIVDGPLSGEIIYTTGKFAYGKKAELKQLIESYGGTFAEKYSKKETTLLIEGSLKGSTKAASATCKVMREQEFLKMLGM